MSSPEKRTELFTHLLRREALRQAAGAPSRYERGDGELLRTIREMSRLCPMSLKIYIVQPGVKKSGATRDQLELLSVTENHLKETYQLDFGVLRVRDSDAISSLHQYEPLSPDRGSRNARSTHQRRT